AGFVAVPQYGPASELARSMPADMPVLGVDPRWAFFMLPAPQTGAGPGLLVWPGSGADPDPAQWPGLRMVGGAGRGTPEEPIEVFRLYSVSRLPAGVAAARLPSARTAIESGSIERRQ
ncbi:MAG TPA: hypothetical protein VFN42_00040, partial [Acetobacteraceae bacterium]|nr:hypothetical protein [Acetobacteraceae bacterium]